MTEEKKHPKDPMISLEIVRWWEKKRLIFNLILLPLAAITLYLLWKDVGVWIGKTELLSDVFWVFVWLNVMYTTGWAGGILRHYYLGGHSFSNVGRWILFILGTIFSLLVLEIRISILVNPFFIG